MDLEISQENSRFLKEVWLLTALIYCLLNVKSFGSLNVASTCYNVVYTSQSGRSHYLSGKWAGGIKGRSQILNRTHPESHALESNPPFNHVPHFESWRTHKISKTEIRPILKSFARKKLAHCWFLYPTSMINNGHSLGLVEIPCSFILVTEWHRNPSKWKVTYHNVV